MQKKDILFSYKTVVATSVAEFDLVKKKNCYVIIIKHASFTYSLIESQLLPGAPACSYKFHALAVYLHLTFAAPFQSEAH